MEGENVALLNIKAGELRLCPFLVGITKIPFFKAGCYQAVIHYNLDGKQHYFKNHSKLPNTYC